MKIKHTLTLTVILMLATASVAQTIRRVNNNPGITGSNIYVTLQAAHDAASNGDVIYVEGSTTAYGDLTCTKQLTLIGPGYFLNQNFTNYPDIRTAIVGFVAFNTGSAGSAIYGMVFNHNAISVRVSNITISRNNLVSVSLDGGANSTNNISVTKNNDMWIYRTSGTGTISIMNNYIVSCSMSTGFTGSFSNNMVRNNANNGVCQDFKLTNFAVTNNIRIGGCGPNSGNYVTFTNCVLNNNLDVSNDSVFGTTNGNQGAVVLANIFLGSTGTTTDSQWKLNAGSPAIAAGVGGVDCGMFGGLDPYVLSGINAAPQILKLNATPAGSNTTPLSVTVDIKSNN